MLSSLSVDTEYSAWAARVARTAVPFADSLSARWSRPTAREL